MGLEVDMGLVGYQGRKGSGTRQPARLDDTGAVVVNPRVPPYFLPVFDGANFISCSDVTAGIAPGTAIGTSPAISLANPPNSGVVLVLEKIFLAYVSGTLAEGPLVAVVNPTSDLAKVSAGTALVPVNAYVGSGGKPQGVVTTGVTLSIAPTFLRKIYDLVPFAGAGVVPPIPDQFEIGGSILLAPGAILSLVQVAGAGTTPRVSLGFQWQEVTL